MWDRWNNTRLCDHRQHYAKVNDPETKRAREMTHGKQGLNGYDTYPFSLNEGDYVADHLAYHILENQLKIAFRHHF